jgi:hypothetical protein
MQPGQTDASFLSGVTGIRALKTSESFATRTRFHVEEVHPLSGESLHEPIVMLIPLKHARDEMSSGHGPTCMSWDNELDKWN